MLRELFGSLLGAWTGVEEQAGSPWAAAASARAMLTFKLGVADQVVLQDYRQVRSDGGEFSVHGVFMALPSTEPPAGLAADLGVGWWLFDSYGEPPERATGRWSDGDLVLHKATPRGVAEHRFRPAGDQLDYTIRVRLGEQPEFAHFLRGRYSRMSGH